MTRLFLRFFVTILFILLTISKSTAQYGPFYTMQRNLKSYSHYDNYIEIIKTYNILKETTVALAKIDSLAKLVYNQGDLLQYLFLKNEVSNFYKFDSRFNEGYADLYDAMQNYASKSDTINIEYAVSLRLLRGLATRSDYTSRGEEELLRSQLNILEILNIEGEPMTNTLVDYGLFYNRKGEKDKSIDLLYQARTFALEDNDLMSFALADYTLISNVDGIDLEETIIEVLKNDLELLSNATVNIPMLVYKSFFNYIIGNRYFWDFNNVEKAIVYNTRTTECLDTLQYPMWNLKSSSHSLLAMCYSELNDTANFWSHYRIAKNIALDRPMSHYNRGLALITLAEAALPISVDSSQYILDTLRNRVESANLFKERITKNQALIYLQQGQLAKVISTINRQAISFDVVDGIEIPAISDTTDYQVQLTYFDILNESYVKSDDQRFRRSVLKDIISKQNQLYIKIVEKEVFGHEISSIIANYNKFINTSLSFLLNDFTPDSDMKLASKLFFSSKALQLNNNLGKSLLQSQVESDTLEFNKLLYAINRVQLVRNELAKDGISQEKRAELELRLNQALIESLMARYRMSKGFDLEFQSIRIPTLAEVQQKLENDQGILELCIDENTLNWLVISSDNAVAGQIEFNDLQGKISEEIYKIKTGRIQTVLGSQIFDSRLESKILPLKKLTIVPSNELSLIPFELLELPSTSRKIIESHTISYSYSTSLWYMSKRDSENINHTTPSFLAVAPLFNETETQQTSALHLTSDYRGLSPLPPLHSSKEEVEGINSMFERRSLKALSLVGQDATEEKLNPQLNNFDILHFATHGLVNKENPERSGLYLYPNPSTNIQNNFLSLGQLHSLKIKANLAVLSACNTGTGTIAEGEGVMALPRGFIFAGVPNVIASLWKVNDERTKELMVLFYKNLLNGNSYANALRLAKLDCIEKGFLPLDWAGFVLTGS